MINYTMKSIAKTRSGLSCRFRQNLGDLELTDD